MSNEKKYYEITGARAVGYLNRIKIIDGDNGKQGIAVTIAALNGPEDAVKTATVDAFVRGDKAQALIKKCDAAVQAEEKVLVTFKMGGIRPSFYMKEEEVKPILKANIFYIGSIRKNGEVVYKDEGGADSGSTD